MKTGNFPVQVLDVYFHKTCILPRVVEAIKEESAWKISRYIRERIYHIMGIFTNVEIKEVIRKKQKAELTDDIVFAVSLKKNPVLVTHCQRM